MDLSQFPKTALAHLPTPLEEMKMLRGRLNCKPRLFVKRDDCTGLAFGGNKTRKLEYTMADAISQGANVIITTGGVQSNHVRQTAAAAAKLGMKFHAVLSNPLAQVTEAAGDCYVSNGNVLLDRIFGAHLHFVQNDAPATAAKISEIVAGEQAAGNNPYVVPLGASDGIGAMGYVECAQELLKQFAEQGIDPGQIVLGTGSAGTHGGLLFGLRAFGSPIQVVGISVSEPAEAKRSKVKSIVRQIAEAWKISPVPLDESDVIVLDGYVGDGYGRVTEACLDAIRMVATTEGIVLDPVYTAKAMAGMLDLLRTDWIDQQQDSVFLHTGGPTSVFAYPGVFESKRAVGT